MRKCLLTVCVWVASAGLTGVLVAAEPPARRTSVARLDAEPCNFPVAPEVAPRLSCHRLTVPRDYADRAQGTYGLAVVVLKAEHPEAGRDPVLLLHGGPGGRGFTSAAGRARSSMFPGADIVTFDQRANGRSDPHLCDDIPSALVSAVVAPGDFFTTAWLQNEPHFRCRARFENAGVRPEHFGTRVTTEDAEQLRLALGIKRWNVQAFSYGTVVALDMMAAHPAPIRAVVLDSLVSLSVDVDQSSPDFNRGLRNVFAACAADATCGQRYPDLAGDFAAAVASFTAQPLLLPATEKSTAVDLNGGDLDFLVRRMMRSTKNIASLPALIRAAKARDVTALRPLADAALATPPETSALGRPAIMCRDLRERFVAAPTHAVELGRMLGLCAAWGPPAQPSRIPRDTPLPVLVLMGGLDPLYEPATVRSVTTALGPRAHVILFPNRTHAIYAPGCAESIVTGFFTHPDTPPDASCVASEPKIDFAAAEASPK